MLSFIDSSLAVLLCLLFARFFSQPDRCCVWLHRCVCGCIRSRRVSLSPWCTVSVQSVRTGSKQASTCGGRETAAVNTLFSGNSVQLKAPRHQLPLQPQQLLLSESSALLSSSTSKLFNRPNFGLTSDDNWSNLLRLIESLSLYFKFEVKPPFYNTLNKDKTKRLQSKCQNITQG